MPQKTVFLVKIGILITSAALLLSGRSVPQEIHAANGISIWNAVLVTAGKSHAAVPKKKRVAVGRKRILLAALPSAPESKYLPIVDQPDIREEHKIIADEVLRLLPAQCRNTLKNFYVRYDNPSQRGLAGKSSAVISGNVPPDEFRALVIHEVFGHVVDLGCFRGTADSGPSGFKDGAEVIYENDPSVAFYRISWETDKLQKAGSKKIDYVTGYAPSDPFEDFAESVAYFFVAEEQMRLRATENSAIAAKLLWIETYVFPNGFTLAKGSHIWKGAVPWDATKLPYVWLGNIPTIN